MASLAPITYFDFDSAHSVGDAYKAGLPRVPDTMSILRGTVQQIQYVLTNQEFTNWLNASVIFMKEGCQPRKCTSLRCDDCNEACTDPEYLFSSWELQWTCLTLASLAVVWPTLSLHAPTGVLLNDTIQRVGIDDIAAFDGERVFDLMRDCAAVGCEEDNCKVDYLPPTAPDNANLILEPYVSGLMRTCEATEISVSNDIAGPGVSL